MIVASDDVGFGNRKL